MRLALPIAGAAALAAIALAALPATAGKPAPNGAQIYVRCAACHTATGAGVPGTYPPLGADFRVQASTGAGRRYLALAVIKGLMGPIAVNGRTYNGVMPAQAGLDDAAVAAVLNHVGTRIATTGPRFRAFTATEVAAARASGATLNAAAVARLHQAAPGQ